MSDLIDRQEAINAFYKYPYIRWTTVDIMAIIKDLPSTQPTQKNESNTLEALDCVSRKAAIDAVKDMYQAAEKWGKEASDDIIKARAETCMATLIEMKLRIEKLPSAQPEVTEEAVKDYCRKRCLTVLTDECFHKLTSAQPEIIRCNDCKSWKLSEYNTSGIHICKKFSGVREEHDFCSRAEMRGEEHD